MMCILCAVFQFGTLKSIYYFVANKSVLRSNNCVRDVRLRKAGDFSLTGPNIG